MCTCAYQTDQRRRIEIKSTIYYIVKIINLICAYLHRMTINFCLQMKKLGAKPPKVHISGDG